MMNEILTAGTPEPEYQAIIADQEKQISRADSRKKLLAVARLLSAVVILILIWGNISYGFSWPAALLALAGIFTFFLLVFQDAKWSAVKRDAVSLIYINNWELNSLKYVTDDILDDGSEFSETFHAYAGDLDLFGSSSLYQWINRASGFPGRSRLAFELKNGVPDESLKRRQDAIRELAGDTAWTQSFRLKSMTAPLDAETQVKIGNWLAQDESFLDKPVWKKIIVVHSLSGLLLLVLWILGIFPLPAFALGFLVLRFIAFGISGRIVPMYSQLSKTAPEMEGLYGQLACLESARFQSPLLQKLQQRENPGSVPAMAEMRKLYLILKRFDIRLNLVVSNILNTFFVWDLRQALALRKWKIENRERLPSWIDNLAETEVLISLAALAHNHPAWCFPDTDPSYFVFDARDLGHPLIPDAKRVTQHFSLSGPGRTAIITGANMAGKSTFLRSLGINAVLAFMGAPVCATSLRLSRCELITSMRVTDNLAENTSTFYAELKKLEYIIGRLNAGADLFILLDEVLRGTNSEDRHTGTTALVRQLLRGKTASVIATHDTQLARTESERSAAAVDNFHFDGTVSGSELSFDYKLKPGICESLNATALMKKIGIQIGE